MITTVDFTPSWLADKPDKEKPIFHLRLGTILERDQFEAEMEGRHRAGQVLSFQLLEAAIAGVNALVEGDDAAELVDLLRNDAAAGDLSPPEKAKVKAACDILAQHWPEYAALVQAEARRGALLPTLAFIEWCSGWTNLTDENGEEIVYARSKTGALADDVLRRIPFIMIRSAGIEAYGVQYGRAQAKN